MAKRKATAQVKGFLLSKAPGGTCYPKVGRSACAVSGGSTLTWTARAISGLSHLLNSLLQRHDLRETRVLPPDGHHGYVDEVDVWL
jgi:hypothetical protein